MFTRIPRISQMMHQMSLCYLCEMDYPYAYAISQMMDDRDTTMLYQPLRG